MCNTIKMKHKYKNEDNTIQRMLTSLIKTSLKISIKFKIKTLGNQFNYKIEKHRKFENSESCAKTCYGHLFLHT